MEREFEANSRELRRFQILNTSVKDIVTHVCATSAFGCEMRVETARVNREAMAVGAPVNLGLG